MKYVLFIEVFRIVEVAFTKCNGNDECYVTIRRKGPTSNDICRFQY